MPPVLLKQRISAELTRIIGSYVLVITPLLAAVTLLSGYYFKVNQLAHHRDLVATKLRTEVSNVMHELQSLSTSTLLWTGLSDSFGRDNYLEPLLARFNRGGLRQFLILDYRGRPFLAPDVDLAEQVRNQGLVGQAVVAGRTSQGMMRLAHGGPGFVLVQPVLSPVLDSPVGFIVAVLDAQALVDELGLGSDMALAYSLGGADWMPQPQANAWLRDRADVVIDPGNSPVALSVWLAQPVWPSLLAGLGVVLLAFSMGLWTLRRVSAWARRFSASTTERLEQLVDYGQKVLAGESVKVAPQAERDEIAQVVDVLGTMLQQQKAVTDELRTTALVFSTAAEGILVTDPDGVIVEVNPALTRMLGFEREELVGRLAGTLYRVPGQPQQALDIARGLDEHGRWSGETAFVNRAGQVLATAVSVSRIVGADGELQGQVAVITDVSRLKAAENQLRALAYRDPLTRLPNLRSMSEQVDQRLRERPQQPFVLLFMDLDGLKAINDSHGHEAGDRMIQGMAAHLREQLPEGHLLCRRSGDEFIVLIDVPPDATGSEWEKSLQRLAHAQVRLPAGEAHISATIGAARYPQDAQTWAELQVCADVAMNEAKRVQRGSVAWYDDRLGQKVLRQRLVRRRLALAIEQGVIRVHYQPVVDLASGAILGFEALARWHDEELGEVRPTEFIAVAEEAHLSDRLTLQLLDLILRDKPLIQRRFPGAVLAFNAAPRVFRDARLIRFLADRAEHDPTLLGQLEVELTETDMASSEDRLLRQLQMLTGMGVRLVIDDFGKGYSSLSRLAQYPISCLKIDASFVASLGQGRQTRIVELIVNLAQLLDLQVTAEGVETEAQRQLLLQMGCTRGQGWLFSRAVPLADVLALERSLRQTEAA